MSSKKYRFSPSALNLLFDCPRCFWYAHHGIPRPRGIFPGLPGAIDKIIQGETKGWAGKGKPDWLLPEQKGVINPGPKKLVQQTEEYTLTGIVDDIVISEDDKLIIIDYKTARRPYTQEMAQKYYSLQIDCYALLCEGHYSQQVKAAYLVFFTPAKLLNLSTDTLTDFQFDITHVEMPVNPGRAKEVLAEAVDMLSSETPPAGYQNCEYCRWIEQKNNYDSKLGGYKNVESTRAFDGTAWNDTRGDNQSQ